jgi:hypothetical protein
VLSHCGRLDRPIACQLLRNHANMATAEEVIVAEVEVHMGGFACADSSRHIA